MTRAAKTAATTKGRTGNVGDAVLGFCGHWVGHGLLLAVTHPLNSAMALVLTTGIAYGATNAMFLQTVRHPAPLFMDSASIAHPVETAPMPAAKRPMSGARPIPATTSAMAPDPTTATAAAVPAAGKIGNKDVADLQARLGELGFFAGTIDGYYGPRTAEAIRRFETAAGLTPVGAATEEVLAAATAYRPMPAPTPDATTTPADPAPVMAETVEPVLDPADDPIGSLVADVALADPVVATAPAAAPVAGPETSKKLPAAVDAELVRMVQTGLSRLGFLHVEVSGKFDAETARAIREFENYNNYQVTGALTPDLIDVLMANGAFN